MEHKIKLTFGYTDKQGKLHDEVVFGKRLKVTDMILLETDPRSQSPAQREDLVRNRSITKFGDLKVPVSLDILLGLTMIDRQDLEAGFDRFCEVSREDRKSEYRDNNIVQLRFGFDFDGTEYNVIELGKMTTGRDELDAENANLSGLSKECFLIGRRITKATTLDGAVSIDGPFEFAQFRDLDAEDLNLLRIGARMADAFFRIRGKASQEVEPAAGGNSPNQGNGNDREGDPGTSETAADHLPAGDQGAKQ